jgi:GNAT superfamily N-acetyltransferase
MLGPMVIRFAEVSDAATLLRFVQALADYEKMPHAVEVDEKTLADELASDNPPFECLLAEETGSAVGFALFFHTYSTWRGRRGIWLEDLFVLPEHRRRGVGKRLLERLVEIAHERRCGRVEWSVLEWNVPAIDFYRSFGAELLETWRICRMSL